MPDEALATREQCGEGARPQGNLVLEDLPERVQRQYAQALGTVSQPGVVGHVREELDSSRDVRAGACDCRPGKHSSSADHHGSSFKSGNAAASDLRVQRVMSSYQNSPWYDKSKKEMHPPVNLASLQRILQELPENFQDGKEKNRSVKDAESLRNLQTAH